MFDMIEVLNKFMEVFSIVSTINICWVDKLRQRLDGVGGVWYISGGEHVMYSTLAYHFWFMFNLLF